VQKIRNIDKISQNRNINDAKSMKNSTNTASGDEKELTRKK